MVPLLLLADIIIWYGVAFLYQKDKPPVSIPTEPINTTITNLSEKDEDQALKQDFENWLEKQSRKEQTMEDFLWAEGIINPEEAIWCNGVPLQALHEDDMKRFMLIKNQAYLEGTYNSKNLNEGGEEDLYKAWLMLKGCSDFGAEKLLGMGIKPWEFEF